MEDVLLNRIKEDLEKSGLGSELKACKVFEKNGWYVQAGSAYYDEEEQKSREIDIVATMNSSVSIDEKNIIFHELHIHAEVKKSEKPWVIFKTKQGALGGSAWNNLISAIYLPTKEFNLVKYITKSCLIRNNGWKGTGVHEAFKNPNNASRWYGSFITAIKSSIDSFKNSPNNDIKNNGYSRYTSNILEETTEIHFFQPLIVLDGKMVSAELDENNEILLEHIDTAAFDFDYKSKYIHKDSFRVDIVTLNGLDTYIEKMKRRQIEINQGIVIESNIKIEDCEFN